MLTADVTAFFSAAEFATAASLDGQAVLGIFDAPSAQGGVGAYGMAALQPVYTLASASVPADVVGLGLVVGSTPYTVAAHEPDGTGISRLLLEAA